MASTLEPEHAPLQVEDLTIEPQNPLSETGDESIDQESNAEAAGSEANGHDEPLSTEPEEVVEASSNGDAAAEAPKDTNGAADAASAPAKPKSSVTVDAKTRKAAPPTSKPTPRNPLSASARVRLSYLPSLRMLLT
jgi:hypothetical protein